MKFDGWPCKTIAHLFYFKLCASFCSHWWIQFWIAVRKRSIWVKIGNFLFRVTLKLNRWPWKTIEHLFFIASSFVHHFIAFSEFKLELQSGNAQFWSKWTIFLAVWPWNLMDGLQKQKGTSSMLLQALCSILEPNWSFSLEMHNLGQFQRILEPCDLEIRWMTLKNNRAPLLCYFKHCEAFRTHWWIQTGVTVRKRPIWVKFNYF